MMLKKINRTYVIIFMGCKTPNCGLMDILVEKNTFLLLYALMGEPQLASEEIERLPSEGQFLKDFFDL